MNINNFTIKSQEAVQQAQQLAQALEHQHGTLAIVGCGIGVQRDWQAQVFGLAECRCNDEHNCGE